MTKTKMTINDAFKSMTETLKTIEIHPTITVIEINDLEDDSKKSILSKCQNELKRRNSVDNNEDLIIKSIDELDNNSFSQFKVSIIG